MSYCKKYNENELNKLITLENEVYALRYNQETICDSLIDLYDTKTTELINKVRNLKTNTPELLQHPLADQLENEILKADNEELIQYRKKYDASAIEYNNFLTEHKNDPALKNFKMKKLFSVNS